MRQNLTPAQVLSLSPEAQQALREWACSHQGDEPECICIFDSSGKCTYSECSAMQLNIGQCLQLLAEHGVFVNLAGPYPDGCYELQYVSSNMANRNEWTTEPIDALYAAVKAVLEVGA